MTHRERDKTRTGRTGRKLYQTSATEDVLSVAIVAVVALPEAVAVAVAVAVAATC